MLNRKTVSSSIPVLLTLYPMAIKLVEEIPVVPISNFMSFVNDLPMYLDKIKLVSR